MVDRPKLLWFGRPPTAEDVREATNRYLNVEVMVPEGPVDFTHARAAIFWGTNGHFDPAMSALEQVLVPAVDNGLFLYVVVEDVGQLNYVRRVFDTRHPHAGEAPSHRLRTSTPADPVPAHEAPQQALMHRPGPAARSSLLIEAPPDVVVSDAHRLLLQRAFFDCKAIKLIPIGGGLSGALTFYVTATLAASNAGATPVPFFAKLDDSEKLRKEMTRFRDYAEHHVAWYLRPNFLPDRCIYGVDQGVLVGAFVEDSKSPWQVAIAGEGSALIRSLFKETLWVLRQDAEVVDPAASGGSLIEPLETYCKYWDVKGHRVELSKQFGGEVFAPATLWRKLLSLPTKKWLRSSIHGDMHGNNAQVRKSDAIVIDFAHAAKGPMSADLASLEVWLSFEWPEGQPFDRRDWRDRIEYLYRPEIISGPAAAGDPEAVHWLLPCVREIRSLAGEASLARDEYLRILAVYLLRHATFPASSRDTDDDEYRRAFAHWLAGRIVLWLCKTERAELETA
jgi:hypothetical protein